MTPYVGQIALVAFNFAPVGWALCNGQLLSIAQNTALYSLLGTTYGGDGMSTFALPNLQSRIPLHQGQNVSGSNYQIGQTGGFETVSLTDDQIPSHSHLAQCFTGVSNSTSPVNAVWAQASNDQPYKGNVAGTVNMAADAIGEAGGGQPHPNLMSYQALNYVIALQGIYPSQS